MAATPRCPAPAGSSGEGPTGSATTASAANSPSQASRSFARTAACERRASRRASAGSFVPGKASPSDLRDDVLAESVERRELLGERLSVWLGHVRPAETDRDVGDALVLEAPDPVHAVGIR